MNWKGGGGVRRKKRKREIKRMSRRRGGEINCLLSLGTGPFVVAETCLLLAD